MGQGITIECKSCRYVETFYLGIGFMYSSLENVIDLVSPKRKEKVLNILQRKDVHDITYEHKLFICPKCNHIKSRFDFSITYGDNQEYKPYFQCSECRKKLVPLKKPIESIPCPNCDKKTLIQNASIMWD